MLQIYSCVQIAIEIVILLLFVYKSLLFSVISLCTHWYTYSAHMGYHAVCIVLCVRLPTFPHLK